MFLLTGCGKGAHEKMAEYNQLISDSIAKEKTESERATVIISQSQDRDFQIVTIDGCEYIFYSDNNNTYAAIAAMCHKGNCKNHNP